VSLAVAVFDENIGQLEALADRPESTLDDLFDAIASQAIASTAIIDLIASQPHNPLVEQLGIRVSAVVGTVLMREQLAGTIAAAIETADVMLAVAMLAFATSKAEPDARADIQARTHTIFRSAFANRDSGR
jgi:hypothetical protein